MGGSIGFIGLGRMDRPMAANAVRRDFSALLDALCRSCGTPTVRFTEKAGQQR